MSINYMIQGWATFTTYYDPVDLLTAFQNTSVVIDAIASETKYCQLGQFNSIMDNLLDSGLQGIIQLFYQLTSNYSLIFQKITDLGTQWNNPTAPNACKQFSTDLGELTKMVLNWYIPENVV